VDTNKPAVGTLARPKAAGESGAVGAAPETRGGLSGGTKALIFLGIVGGAGVALQGPIRDAIGGAGGAQCGPQPSIDFDFRVQSRPSDAQLAALKAYCTCQGWGYGNANGGFGCLK
jgi:hypothetical protein